MKGGETTLPDATLMYYLHMYYNNGRQLGISYKPCNFRAQNGEDCSLGTRPRNYTITDQLGTQSRKMTDLLPACLLESSIQDLTLTMKSLETHDLFLMRL